MKRTFNYTGRNRIEKQKIELDVADVDGSVVVSGRVLFDSPDTFPASAVVLIYVKCGAIRREMEIGPVRTEVKFSAVVPGLRDHEGVTVDFRVFDLADPSRRLLALARGVRGGNRDSVERESLLITKHGDFDVPLWRVETDFENGPYLALSRRCVDYRQFARRDEFLSLVMPAVVRQIAYAILLENDYDGDPDEDDDRQADWMRFMAGLPGVEKFRPGMSRTARLDLIEQVEAGFAREVDVLRRGSSLVGITEGEED